MFKFLTRVLQNSLMVLSVGGVLFAASYFISEASAGGALDWFSSFFKDTEKTEADVAVKPRRDFKPFVSKRSEVKSLGVFQLMPGDKLKISFFEQISLTGKSRPKQRIRAGEAFSRDPNLRSFYERKDLSGPYNVTEAGQIIIPVLGAVKAAGKDLPGLKKDIEKLYKDYAGRTIEVSLKIIERPPVFVSGIVAQPGVYKYIMGMTVKHAVTLASGLRRGELSRTMGAEINKEQTRLKINKVKLEHALLERSKLETIIAGRSVMKVPPKLVKLIGASEAKRKMRKRQRIVDLTNRFNRQKRKKLTNAVRLAGREINSLRRHKDTVKRQFRAARNHVLRIKNRYLPGYIRVSRKLDLQLTELENKMMTLEGQESSIMASLSTAQLKKDLARQELASLSVAQNVGMVKKLSEVEKNIIEYEMNMEGAKGAINQYQIAATNPKAMPVNTNSRFSITRRKGAKQIVMAAKSDTLLKPGDIVTVSAIKLKK